MSSPSRIASLERLSPLVLVGFLALSCGGRPAFDRRAYLQQLTSDSVWIVSESAMPLAAEVEYAKLAGEPEILTSAANSHDHRFHLTGLEPDTEYAYELRLASRRRYRGSFRTLPGPSGTIRIVALGDSGHRPDGAEQLAQDRVRDTLTAIDTHLVLHTGDLVYPKGTREAYQHKFFDVYADHLARVPWFPCPGNHDASTSLGPYREAFHLPTNGPRGDELDYSFDAGPAHVVSLASHHSSREELEEWLARDLEATERPWKIVYFHHPPFSTGKHGGDRRTREELVPILERLSVDLVLCGHEHHYERFFPIRQGRAQSISQEPSYDDPSGVTYVTTGGGGAPLYDGSERSSGAVIRHDLSAHKSATHHLVRLTISPEQLAIEALDANGDVFDRATISKRADR